MPAPKVTTRFQRLGCQKRARYALATQYPGMSGYTDSQPVTEHVRLLNSLGLPCRSIARDAGVCEETVQQIARGDRAIVRTRHSSAILTVGHHPTPEQDRVIAIGAIRRLQALSTIGWPWTPLAARTPFGHRLLCKVAIRPQVTVAYPFWSVIHDLYEQVSGTPGPHAGTRVRAAARGWHSTLDWDGLDIDDPRVFPSPAPAFVEPTAKDVRQAEVARLLGKGWTGLRIAYHLGVSTRTIERDCAEINNTNIDTCFEVPFSAI